MKKLLLLILSLASFADDTFKSKNNVLKINLSKFKKNSKKNQKNNMIRIIGK
ncbi:hypothetical protein [Streptobacillus notomytis]|uniref:hypothetical protein n=1 Tax=Streptobacillus notomytis TaxID=1712031 RepID=UPI000AD5EC79|nr:hypothetical protein [Streptobacillus notomytis]